MQLQVINDGNDINDEYLNKFYHELYDLTSLYYFNMSYFINNIHTSISLTKFNKCIDKYDVLLELYRTYCYTEEHTYKSAPLPRSVFFNFNILSNFQHDYFSVLRKNKLKQLLK